MHLAWCSIIDPYFLNLNYYLSAFLKSELAVLFQILHDCRLLYYMAEEITELVQALFHSFCQHFLGFL